MVRVGAAAVVCAALAAVGVVQAAKCSDYDTCAECTAAPECGQCLLPPTEQNGVPVQEQRCVAGNETGPFDPTRVCERWSIVSCSCPLDCSSHGKCDEDGTCECGQGWRGTGCSFEAAAHGKPGVLIPVALLCAVILVGILVGAQMFSNSDRCWNRRSARGDEKKQFNKPYQHPGQGEAEASTADSSHHGLLERRRG